MSDMTNTSLNPVQRAYMETVAAEQGELAVNYLYEAAKEPANPLHAWVFNKPVSEAAEAYYKDNVRSLIRAYTITIVTPGQASETMRGFVNIVKPGTQEHVYVTVEKATTNLVLREQMLKNLQRDIATLERKYGMLSEYQSVLAASIDNVSVPV